MCRRAAVRHCNCANVYGTEHLSSFAIVRKHNTRAVTCKEEDTVWMYISGKAVC